MALDRLFGNFAAWRDDAKTRLGYYYTYLLAPVVLVVRRSDSL